MAGPGDLAKLKRALDELEDVVTVAQRGRMKESERRLLRSEIETALQRLDELRNRLAG
jgi:hypothetical protein